VHKDKAENEEAKTKRRGGEESEEEDGAKTKRRGGEESKEEDTNTQTVNKNKDVSY